MLSNLKETAYLGKKKTGPTFQRNPEFLSVLHSHLSLFIVQSASSEIKT